MKSPVLFLHLICFAYLFTVDYLFYNTTPYLSSFFWSHTAAHQQFFQEQKNKGLNVKTIFPL